MSRLEFRVLNATAALLVALLLAHFFVTRGTTRLGAELSRQRNAIANARQVDAVYQQLAQRIARGSDADPRLKALLPRSMTPPPAPVPAPVSQPTLTKPPRK